MLKTLLFHCVGVLSHQYHTRRTCQVQQGHLYSQLWRADKLNKQGFYYILNTGAFFKRSEIIVFFFLKIKAKRKVEATDAQLHTQIVFN